MLLPTGLPNEPSERIKEVNKIWQSSWRSSKQMGFKNTNHYVEVLQTAQQHCAGHSVIWGSGPWKISRLFQLVHIIPRQLNETNVESIYTLLSTGSKHDWLHPMSCQIAMDEYSVGMLEAAKQADPSELIAKPPPPLVANFHTEEFMQSLLSCWTETDLNGNYLSREELGALNEKISAESASLPLLNFMQGAHRLAALSKMDEDLEIHRSNMISFGRTGDVENFEEELNLINNCILSSSFLVSLYPSDMPQELSLMLCKNPVPLPSQETSFGEEVTHLRKQAEKIAHTTSHLLCIS
ncbi:hypothetical protein FRC11_006648 [Ceratobasidium sp. 423]|nr:hypothetical protein FRC11_006648 [Ceratobasidium sp. 423]